MVSRYKQKDRKVTIMTIHTAAEIVAQRFVEIHAQRAAIEEQYEELKKALLALNVDEIPLDDATIKVSEGIRFTLDNKAVVSELGQNWVDDHTKLTQYKLVRVTYKAAARKAA